MAKLNIDIGVNLGNSLKAIEQLQTSFDNLSTSLDKFTSQVNTLKTSLSGLKSQNLNIKINQSTTQTGGGITQPKLSPVENIFKEYISGAVEASTVTEFLKAKQQELKDAIQALNQVPSGQFTKEQTQQLKQYQRELGETQRLLKLTSGEQERAAKSAGKMIFGQNQISRTTGQANMVLTNFGRLAQDSAYGILGISNNINPLVESWSQLNAEAKKTPDGSVWKSLATSLAGPGGLAIGFSLVTAALSFAAVGLSYWTRTTKEAKEPLTDLQKKTKEAEESFKSFKESVYAESGKEITRVNELIIVINSETETRKRKNAALKELKEINPEVFGQLKLEKDSIAALNLAYEAYIKNITNVVAVKILEKQIEDKTAKVLELQGVGIDKNEKSKRKFNQVTRDGLNDQAKYIRSIGGTAGGLENFAKSIDKAGNSAQGRQEQINSLNDEIKGLYEELKPFVKGIDLKIDETGKGTNKEKLKTFSEAVNEIKDDLQKIQGKPFLTQSEKDLSKIARLKEGIDYLRDAFKKEYEIDIKDKGGAVNAFLRKISGLQISIQTNDAVKQFKDFQQSLSFTKKFTLLFDRKELNSEIAKTETQLELQAQNFQKLAMTPIDPNKFSAWATGLLVIDTLVKSINNTLLSLRDAQVANQLKGIWDEYNKSTAKADDQTQALNDILEESGSKGLKTGSAKLQNEIKKYEGILNKGITAFYSAKDVTKGAPNWVTTMMLGIVRATKDKLTDLSKQLEIEKLKEKLSIDIQAAFEDAFMGIAEGIGAIFSGESAGDVFGGVFAKLSESLGRALLDFSKQAAKAQGIMDVLRKALFGPGPIAWGAIAATAALGIALIASGKLLGKKGFAKGGFVSGDGDGTSDSIHARLSNGEYVVRARSVSKYGIGFLDAINQGTFKRFAQGGLVTNIGIPDLQPVKWRAIVNRGMNIPSQSGYIAETRISGQDLRLVLSRSDNRFNSSTSNPVTSKSSVI